MPWYRSGMVSMRYAGVAVATIGVVWFAWPGLARVSLHVDFASATDYVAVRWDRGRGYDPDFVEVRQVPADGTVTVTVPTTTRSVRIDPRVGPGDVDIAAIRVSGLFTWGRWDAANSFAGWRPAGDAKRLMHSSNLRVVSAGAWPQISHRGIGKVVRRTVRIERWIVTSAVALFVVLLGFLGSGRRRQGRVRAHASRATRVGRRENVNVAGLALGVGSLVLFGAVAWGLYAWLRQPPETGYDDAGGAYSLSFIDWRGARLSGQRGPLRMLIDPWTFYRPAPGQRTEHFLIDEHGFRDGVPAGDAPLLAVLGGSATFGYGLKPGEQTICGRLGDALGMRPINAGVPGFLSGQELSHMVHRVDPVRPAHYVVFNGWNDLVGMLERPARPVAVNGMFFAFTDRLRNDYLDEAGADADDAFRITWPPSGVGDAVFRCAFEYVSNLERMKAWAHERGATFLVAFQPIVFHRERRSPSEARIEFNRQRVAEYFRFLDIAAEMCRTAGISFVDVGADARVRTADDTLFLDPVHLTAAGCRVVADVLADRFAENRVLGR